GVPGTAALGTAVTGTLSGVAAALPQPVGGLVTPVVNTVNGVVGGLLR
ncbi:hypothetical protein GXW73_32535, partial [Roseomonas hellenica]|nr:hypothetical protein [Plastoroseomonas hellenica]